jgi:hypothetical protein
MQAEYWVCTGYTPMQARVIVEDDPFMLPSDSIADKLAKSV